MATLMKIFAITLTTLISSTLFLDTALASSERSSCKNVGEVYVSGYTRKNGVRVKAACRTARNETKKVIAQPRRN